MKIATFIILSSAAAFLVRKYSSTTSTPVQGRITSDFEGHYDIDGVSLGAGDVVVASDAQSHSRPNS